MAVKKETGLSYAQILSEIKGKKFRPIYILMGEESYYIDNISKAIVENALTEDEQDFNLSTFYGADADVKEVIS